MEAIEVVAFFNYYSTGVYTTAFHYFKALLFGWRFFGAAATKLVDDDAVDTVLCEGDNFLFFEGNTLITTVIIYFQTM